MQVKGRPRNFLKLEAAGVNIWSNDAALPDNVKRKKTQGGIRNE